MVRSVGIGGDMPKHKKKQRGLPTRPKTISLTTLQQRAKCHRMSPNVTLSEKIPCSRYTGSGRRNSISYPISRARKPRLTYSDRAGSFSHPVSM